MFILNFDGALSIHNTSEDAWHEAAVQLVEEMFDRDEHCEEDLDSDLPAIYEALRSANYTLAVGRYLDFRNHDEDDVFMEISVSECELQQEKRTLDTSIFPND